MAITNNNLRSTDLFLRNGAESLTTKDAGDLIVNDLKRLIEEDNTLQFQIDSIVAGDMYDEITAAALVAKRTASTLAPGKAYKITDLAEPLIVYALAVNKLSFWAYSPTYPQDIIVYNTSDALSANWKIIYREDTINHLIVQGINADWRTTPLFGAGCTKCSVVNWYANTITIGTNCNNIYIDMTLAGENIAIGNSVTKKRLEEGFSNFETSLAIDGLSTIDLIGIKYAGIINMTDASELSSEQIDNITNSSGNHSVTFRPTATMTTTWRDKSISAGNLHLESTPAILLGAKNDEITFEKIGTEYYVKNIENYL